MNADLKAKILAKISLSEFFRIAEIVKFGHAKTIFYLCGNSSLSPRCGRFSLENSRARFRPVDRGAPRLVRNFKEALLVTMKYSRNPAPR